MITVSRICANNTKIDISEVKKYINIVDDCRNAEIQSLLASSISRIEEYCSVSLREGEYELTQDFPVSIQKLPYTPVLEVISVRDSNGLDLPFSLDFWNTLRFSEKKAFVCRYKTDVSKDIDNYKAAVFAYTGLMFDGYNSDDAFEIVTTKYLPKISML